MNKRRKGLLQLLHFENLDGLLVNSGVNLRYLTGFTGSNGLALFFDTENVFITDFRYKDQIKQEVKGLKTIIAERELFGFLPELKIMQHKKLKVGFEANWLSYKNLSQLKKLLPEILWIPTENTVESLRLVKDSSEITAIKKACQVVDEVFYEILPLIRPGVLESDLALELEYKIKKRKAQPAFETIVASGKRSALPHGRASFKKILKEEFVTLDFGACVNGYISDITRTVVAGKASRQQKKIYNIVLKAQEKAIQACRPGMKTFELDAKARNLIRKSGYGKNFGHGLGHGIGLLVHEGPAVNPRSNEVLKENMVFTIEPGIYISDWGGVRIEDDILLTKSGPQILTTAEKNLLEL